MNTETKQERLCLILAAAGAVLVGTMPAEVSVRRIR